MSTTPKPYVDPGHTKVTLRTDLKQTEPIEVASVSEAIWAFGGVPVDRITEVWRGEGDRCEATFPPTRPEGSIQCELVAGHFYFCHWAPRSSV